MIPSISQQSIMNRSNNHLINHNPMMTRRHSARNIPRITHKDSYKISKLRNNHCLRNPILRNIFLSILPYKIITNNLTSINLTTYRNYRPGSVVSIATGYGLDGPRTESRRGRYFPHLSRPALGPTQSPVKWVPCLSRG